MRGNRITARQEFERKEQHRRDVVIAEFDAGETEATMHAMAAEILRYRENMARLAEAVALAQAGAPFALIRPGPKWRPRDF
jgi:hypothetical protein